jgi:hypothetical protein
MDLGIYAAVGTNVVIIVIVAAIVILALLAAGVGRSRRKQKLAEREVGLQRAVDHGETEPKE